MEIQTLIATPVMTLGNHIITVGAVMAVAAILMATLLLWLALSLSGQSKARALSEAQMVERTREAEDRMADILKSQSEMQGRMQTMAEIFGSRQSEMTQAIRERLDGMTNRIGQTMVEQTKSTHENLAKLQERLAVIDSAQANISALAGQVVTLQSILNNKQTRGAFGQARMEAIVADGLPHGAYEFQATLSTNVRPDCLIRMPNGAPSLAIDAKFPLESWNAIKASEAPDMKRVAETQLSKPKPK